MNADARLIGGDIRENGFRFQTALMFRAEGFVSIGFLSPVARQSVIVCYLRHDELSELLDCRYGKHFVEL